MKLGEMAFFYHSSTKVPAIVGVVSVAREAYPDPTQFDREDEYYDQKSTEDTPRWFSVDVKLERVFDQV
jgi:predicted RNA-binding protein with PUA-like domain